MTDVTTNPAPVNELPAELNNQLQSLDQGYGKMASDLANVAKLIKSATNTLNQMIPQDLLGKESLTEPEAIRARIHLLKYMLQRNTKKLKLSDAELESELDRIRDKVSPRSATKRRQILSILINKVELLANEVHQLIFQKQCDLTEYKAKFNALLPTEKDCDIARSIEVVREFRTKLIELQTELTALPDRPVEVKSTDETPYSGA